LSIAPARWSVVPAAEARRLLILGGTGEAVALAAEALARFGARLTIISALAGRTQTPRLPAGRHRIGGFGGADGLAAYRAVERIDYLIDATHPFAATISAHAARACAAAAVPRLVLERPPWRIGTGDRWIEVRDAPAAAAEAERLGRRVFLTIGQRTLAAFAPLTNHWFLVRLIEPPATPPPLAQYQLMLGRGPFDASAEAALMAQHAIDLLITRHSGGAATVGKLLAARQRGLPVILIARPAPPPGERVTTLEAALGWLDAALGA
jgi:precorrin-6A/cobalt-precorrin-6A reductase